VLVVEDVVTSGGQVVISTGELRKLGAHKLRALLTRVDLEAAA
jgi:orotate phosphoribosyltransferase